MAFPCTVLSGFILSSVTDNCPSWISGREWIISERMRVDLGLNSQPLSDSPIKSDYQLTCYQLCFALHTILSVLSRSQVCKGHQQTTKVTANKEWVKLLSACSEFDPFTVNNVEIWNDILFVSTILECQIFDSWCDMGKPIEQDDAQRYYKCYQFILIFLMKTCVIGSHWDLGNV